MRKYLAEMIGTMVLVLMGCGSAVFAGNAADALGTGVGTIGVALAFGLSVVAMAYTFYRRAWRTDYIRCQFVRPR